MKQLSYLFLVSTCACAQTTRPANPVDKSPQSGIYTVKARAQAVVLDIVVTDPKGSPVPNLGQGDFTVYEDKIPQQILNFERTTPETSGPDGKSPLPIHTTAELDRLEPNAPVGIIVLDEITSQFADKGFARYSLKKYLDTQGDTMQPTLLMAVGLDHRQVLRDYTTSKSELLEALEKHLATDDLRSIGSSFVNEQFNAAANALVSVAQATVGHTGHKNLIWIGRGFPTLDVTRMLPTDLGKVESGVALLANTLKDSRITLYSIDPQGEAAAYLDQDPDGFVVADPFSTSVSFDTLARATGGQGFHGSNDLKGLIGTSMRDGQTFYTITYRPGNEKDQGSSFRNITVKMMDPGLRASTRMGYYDRVPSPDPSFSAKGVASDKTMYDLVTASKGLLVYDGIPMVIESNPSQPDHYVLKLRASSFQWQPSSDGKSQSAMVMVLYNTYDRKGKVLLAKAYSEHLVLPLEDQASLARHEILLQTTVPSASPTARIRIVIRANASGKLGADNYYLVDRKTLSDPETGVKAQQPRKQE